MADNANNGGDHVNDQVRDAVEQINAMLEDGGSNVRAMSYQVMAHTIGLSLYAAVHQQQQLFILKNAVTTAAVKKALANDPADAMKLIEEASASSDLAKTIEQLKTLMDDLNATYSDLAKLSPKPAAKSKATSA